MAGTCKESAFFIFASCEPLSRASGQISAIIQDTANFSLVIIYISIFFLLGLFNLKCIDSIPYLCTNESLDREENEEYPIVILATTGTEPCSVGSSIYDESLKTKGNLDSIYSHSSGLVT